MARLNCEPVPQVWAAGRDRVGWGDILTLVKPNGCGAWKRTKFLFKDAIGKECAGGGVGGPWESRQTDRQVFAALWAKGYLDSLEGSQLKEG